MRKAPAIDFDLERVKRLRLQYDAAKLAGKDYFFFDGHELFTTYAKYLLEFLEGKFK